jgi:hypothetical protein
MPLSVASHQHVIAMNKAVRPIAVHASQLTRDSAGAPLADDPPERVETRCAVPHDMEPV